MSDFADNSEKEVLDVLSKGLIQTDPVSPLVAEFAKALFTWRDIDAHLAEMSYDSAGEGVATGVRSATDLRMLSFQVDDWTIDIEHNPATGQLLGQISPQSTFTVELHRDGAPATSGSDDRGRFEFDQIGTGPISLVFHLETGESVKTNWIVL